jgi:hypothetical protein
MASQEGQLQDQDQSQEGVQALSEAQLEAVMGGSGSGKAAASELSKALGSVTQKMEKLTTDKRKRTDAEIKLDESIGHDKRRSSEEYWYCIRPEVDVIQGGVNPFKSKEAGKK